MNRLLVIFYSDNPFGSPLVELGRFKHIDDAVKMASDLIDESVECMLINNGEKWLKITNQKLCRLRT